MGVDTMFSEFCLKRFIGVFLRLNDNDADAHAHSRMKLWTVANIFFY